MLYIIVHIIQKHKWYLHFFVKFCWNYKNYILIKNTSNNYQCIGSHYPSPTGRPSNKYPYPVKDYAFIGNYSYASCYYLPYIKLKSIGGNENE